MTFSAFLKQEFNIYENADDNQITIETIRVEKIKKNLSKRIENSSKLNQATENFLSSKNSKIDIDDEIEKRWNKSFNKIKNELLNIDEILNTDRIVSRKKTENIKRAKIIKVKELDAHLLDFSWFVKLSATCAIVLLLAVSTTTFAPDFSNKITNTVNTAFSFQSADSIKNSNKLAEKTRRATISKEAMSAYIVKNRDNLQDLKNGDLIDTEVGGYEQAGRVAGVSSKVNDNEENIFLLFLKKIIKID